MIGFLHIPKTGGTSLRAAFAASGRTVWRPRGPRYTLTLPDLLPDADVVTGHIPFNVFSRLPVDEWVTVLRHPVDRWLSHFFVEAGSRRPGAVPGDMTCRLLSDFDHPDSEVAAETLTRFAHVGQTDQLGATFTRYSLTPHEHRRSDRPRDVDVPAWLTDAAIEANQRDLALWHLWKGSDR